MKLPSVTSRSSSLSYAEIYKCYTCNDDLYAKYACVFRPLVKSEYQKNNFLISQPNICCEYSKELSQ